jgi:hypothetical protein
MLGVQEERQRVSKGRHRERFGECRATPEAFRNAGPPVSGAKEKWNVDSCKAIGHRPDVFVAKVTVEYGGRNVVPVDEL